MKENNNPEQIERRSVLKSIGVGSLIGAVPVTASGSEIESPIYTEVGLEYDLNESPDEWTYDELHVDFDRKDIADGSINSPPSNSGSIINIWVAGKSNRLTNEGVQIDPESSMLLPIETAEIARPQTLIRSNSKHNIPEIEVKIAQEGVSLSIGGNQVNRRSESISVGDLKKIQLPSEQIKVKVIRELDRLSPKHDGMEEWQRTPQYESRWISKEVIPHLCVGVTNV